jgi:O-antigen/teichoic acid export membrane protein
MIREAIRRSLWLAIGAVAGRLLPLVVLILASRWMDSRQFASASAGYAWAGAAMSLTSAGIATVMTQRLGSTSDTREQTRLIAHHLSLSITLAALLALALLLFGKHGGAIIFGDALDPAVVVPSALAAVLWSQVAVCVAALNGCHQARAASLALAASGLLQGAGMAFAICVIGANAEVSMWGLVVGNVLACCIAALLIKRALPTLGWRSGRRVVEPAVPEVALSVSSLAA